MVVAEHISGVSLLSFFSNVALIFYMPFCNVNVQTHLLVKASAFAAHVLTDAL